MGKVGGYRTCFGRTKVIQDIITQVVWGKGGSEGETIVLLHTGDSGTVFPGDAFTSLYLYVYVG